METLQQEVSRPQRIPLLTTHPFVHSITQHLCTESHWEPRPLLGGTESAQAPSETEPRCWLGQGYRRRGQGTEGGFREEVTEDLGSEGEQGWSGTGGDNADPRLADREEASGT